jgi:ADP-heptose:LPS heptosyltransferase
MKKHLLEYFASEMWLNVVTGPRLVLPHLLDIDPGTRWPALPKRYATLHPTAGWSKYKNWPISRWEEVIAARPNIPVYQIGAEQDVRVKGAEHCYMGTRLDTSISLLAHANLHMGVDSFTNHLTNISWTKPGGFTPAVILWGSTQANAAGYSRNINLSAGLHCQPCFREDPKVSRQPRGPCINPLAQSYDDPNHLHNCMNMIDVKDVLAAVDSLWE